MRLRMAISCCSTSLPESDSGSVRKRKMRPVQEKLYGRIFDCSGIRSVEQGFEKDGTALIDIAECGREITAVPGVCDADRGTVGMTEGLDFSFGIASEYPLHVAEIGVIHSDQQIIALVIRFPELRGSVRVTGDMMLLQFRPGRRIDRISDTTDDFLGARRRRRDMKLM